MNWKKFCMMIITWTKMNLIFDDDTETVDVDAYGWDGSGD